MQDMDIMEEDTSVVVMALVAMLAWGTRDMGDMVMAEGILLEAMALVVMLDWVIRAMVAVMDIVEAMVIVVEDMVVRVEVMQSTRV